MDMMWSCLQDPVRLLVLVDDLTDIEHTAQDNENPFIPPLINFIRDLATNPSTQHVKIIGVCFGMQIISLAMGGQCLRGENGWEIGVYGNELTDEGKYWWTGDVEGQGDSNKVVSSCGTAITS